MAIKTRDLRGVSTTTPPIETLLGGQVARKDRVLALHAQADSLLGNDRCVVARVGLHGAASFQTPSTNPASASQTHPLSSVSRFVARTPPVTLQPGHFLVLSALVVPSGTTQKFQNPSWVADFPLGRIDVTVSWTGPTTTTTTQSILLPNSSETWNGETILPGASWAGLRRVEIPLLFPAAVTTNVSDLRAWTDGGVTAEVQIAYRGGVRAVDVVVQQVPYKYARNVGLDGNYASTLATDGAGATVATYPVDYPIERRSASDPCFGTRLLADVVDRQQHGLGPVLCQWTAFSEATTPVTATAVPSVTTTSTSFVNMLTAGLSAWTSSRPGWSLSSGGHAQQAKTAGFRELRDRNGVVPVRCWALCARTVSGTATLRFQSESYSIAELNFSSPTTSWRSCTGYLRTGVSPEDASVLQLLGKAASGSTLSVSCILVEYLDL